MKGGKKERVFISCMEEKKGEEKKRRDMGEWTYCWNFSKKSGTEGRRRLWLVVRVGFEDEEGVPGDDDDDDDE